MSCFPRSSGILLHPTSLPGPFGIGDLGPEAFRFADFLASAGQSIWQMLPLGPTGYGDSPYQLFSAFAGNPLLISPERLAVAGYLAEGDLTAAPSFPENEVDYGAVIAWKMPLLRTAFENFRESASASDRDSFRSFCDRHHRWLDSFAAFMTLKEANGASTIWPNWTINDVAGLEGEIECHKFWQFEFFRQWEALRDYCHQLKIRIMGDIPIYVAHDSADVWSHPELFHLDVAGWPTLVAGVPPDYFSATGQLWGNPIYRWDEMERTGFQWWIDRFQGSFEVLDLVRLDHFRGFEAYWAVPGGQPTAEHGEWIKGPGPKLFEAVERALGHLCIVAENLGVITPEVESMRKRFSFPGMAILQFAFGSDPQAPDFKPHNYPRDVVAYTGTHDNDTVIGWWNSTGENDSTRTAEDVRREKDYTLRYLQTDGREMNWVFIRELMRSVANTVIFPMQDVLGLGSEARMNTPAVPSGNWRWRMRPGELPASRLRELSSLYDRK
jgi:4-alpha-glucanotransferase